MLIGVVRTIALQVVGGNLTAGDIHHGRIAIKVAQTVELAGKTVVKHRGDMRTLLGVEALALNDGSKIDDVVIGHLHAVALLDLALATGKIERFVLGVELIEHGADDVVGARVLAQRIGLGEQETLERIIRSTFEERIVVHIIAGLRLVEEVLFGDAVVRLGHAVGNLVDRQALWDCQCIGAGIGPSMSCWTTLVASIRS